MGLVAYILLLCSIIIRIGAFVSSSEASAKILPSNEELYQLYPDAAHHFKEAILNAEGTRKIHKKQSKAEGQQRKLAVSIAPSFDPPPSTYSSAIGVALIASHPDDLISYTLQTIINPNGTTNIVPSGYVVHIEQTGTLSAFTLGQNGSASSNSPTITGVYNIPFRHFGTAYLVPHHHGSAYSGKLVRINLRTDLLSKVRLHNMAPDLANYYSQQGLAPYQVGMLHVNDLTQVSSDLAGFQNGFSGRCGGEDFGFLAPFFDGSKYSGKAVRVTEKLFKNVSSGASCTTPGGSSQPSCAILTLDFTTLDPELAGFSGGFVSGCYAYFIPYFNGYAFASKVVKVHTVNFTLGNVTILDLQKKDPELAGWYGGFAHNGYGYIAPFRNVKGPVGGYNTHLTCDGSKGTPVVNTQSIGGDHLEPHMFAKFTRFQLDNFTHENVEVLDLSSHDVDIRGFSGAVLVGNHAILIPFRNHDITDGDQGYASKVVKVDLSDFSTVHVLDLASINMALRGYVGGFAWGQYVFLVPHANGDINTNWERRSEHGMVVRIDVNDFTTQGVKYIDLSTAYRQQVPSYPLSRLRGYVQGFASGRHGYFVPYHNGARSGLLVRIALSDFATLADLQAAGNSTDAKMENEGIQVVDLSLYDEELRGFSGGFTMTESGWNVNDS